jgi:hypothetical protein
MSMAEVADRQIAVELAFSEKVWDALTSDLKVFWRECHDDPAAPDMELSDRIDLFLQERATEWLSWLPPRFRPIDLDDGVPF